MLIGFPDREFWAKVDPKLQFWGKNREIGKNWEILEKIEKSKFQHVSIIKMNILAKFHQEKMIFDEIRGHLLILLIYRALTSASEGLLRKKAIKFKGEVLHTPNFYRICLI